ncbi:MAG: alpha/beta hydrolase [Rhodospirillales bacterium]
MPEVIFNGPEGRIEGRYHHATDPNSPVALLLHPHPEYGGTMNNRVVYAMYQSFVKRGFSTLRFNFRGVGRSQGKFDNGQGELSDAATALDWMQGHNPNASTCWIAGFSFGAWVAMQLMMRRPEISGFISAAPPASIYDFSFLAPCPASGLLVHGKTDDVVPVGSVDKLVEKLSAQKNIEIDYRTIDKCDHYFSDHLEKLIGHVEGYLDKRLVEKAA